MGHWVWICYSIVSSILVFQEYREKEYSEFWSCSGLTASPCSAFGCRFLHQLHRAQNPAGLGSLQNDLHKQELSSLFPTLAVLV